MENRLDTNQDAIVQGAAAVQPSKFDDISDVRSSLPMGQEHAFVAAQCHCATPLRSNVSIQGLCIREGHMRSIWMRGGKER